MKSQIWNYTDLAYVGFDYDVNLIINSEKFLDIEIKAITSSLGNKEIIKIL